MLKHLAYGSLPEVWLTKSVAAWTASKSLCLHWNAASEPATKHTASTQPPSRTHARFCCSFPVGFGLCLPSVLSPLVWELRSEAGLLLSHPSESAWRLRRHFLGNEPSPTLRTTKHAKCSNTVLQADQRHIGLWKGAPKHGSILPGVASYSVSILCSERQQEEDRDAASRPWPVLQRAWRWTLGCDSRKALPRCRQKALGEECDRSKFAVYYERPPAVLLTRWGSAATTPQSTGNPLAPSPFASDVGEKLTVAPAPDTGRPPPQEPASSIIGAHHARAAGRRGAALTLSVSCMWIIFKETFECFKQPRAFL